MLFISSFSLHSTELLTQNFPKTPTNYVLWFQGAFFIYQLLQTFTETERNGLILLESQYLGGRGWVNLAHFAMEEEWGLWLRVWVVRGMEGAK